MSSRHGRRSEDLDSIASQPSEGAYSMGSQGSSARPHYGAPSSSYYFSAGGQQAGYAWEVGQDHVGPSQRQVAPELNAANLARVTAQPPGPGPLKQLEDASELVRESVHATFQEIDRLNASILWFQSTVEDLRRRIAEAQSAEEWTQVEDLETQVTNTQERIKQEEQRKEDLRGRLQQGRRLFDGALRDLDLAVTHAGLQPSYPAQADMAEDAEGVPEEARPQMNF